MFITYEAFKHPLQLDPKSATWSAVELALDTPLFVVSTVTKGDDSARTFLLHGTDELLQFAKEATSWRITDLQVLQPPRWSESNEWALVAMREILLQEAPPDGSRASAVARAANGALYGGFPVEAIDGDPGPLSQLAVCGTKAASRRST